jgi:hypothetical protein
MCNILVSTDGDRHHEIAEGASLPVSAESSKLNYALSTLSLAGIGCGLIVAAPENSLAFQRFPGDGCPAPRAQ